MLRDFTASFPSVISPTCDHVWSFISNFVGVSDVNNAIRCRFQPDTTTFKVTKLCEHKEDCSVYIHHYLKNLKHEPTNK